MFSKTETNSKKRKKILILFAAFLLLAVFFEWQGASAQSTYEPMEKIPGFEYSTAGASAQFVSLVENIYKFGIWTVGIAALLMITIGGFMYMTSAGNTSKSGTAKGIITDAIYGLIVALLAWLLLNVINPDLTTINIDMAALSFPDKGNTTPVNPKSAVPRTSTTPPHTPGPGQTTNVNCTAFNGNSALRSEMTAANSGVPPELLAAFMSRECAGALTNINACQSNNSSKAGGPMQFTDATWNDPRYRCTGSKFNRADALRCAATKMRVDTGGGYGAWDQTRVYQAACRYCGSCSSSACGGNYANGVVANWQAYQNC